MKIYSTYRFGFLCIVLFEVLFLTACKSKQPLANETQKIAKTPEHVSVIKFSQAEQMTIDNTFLEGVKFMQIEDHASALTAFMEVLRMDPQHASANFLISKIKLQQNLLSEGEVFAEKASRLSPQNKFYLEHLAYTYRANQKMAQALKCFEQLTKLDPRNDEYWFETANSYLFVEKPLDAIRIYDTIEQRYGISDEISMQKIKIYQLIHKESGIRDELQKLIEKFPNEPKYLTIRAGLNWQAKDYDKVFADYEKILLLDPQNPYIHLSLSDYYQTMKDPEKALGELILAFQNPRLAIDQKIALLSKYFESREQKDETYQLLEALFSAHPEEPKALAIYADFLKLDERYAEARQKYLAVVKHDASKYLVWESLLWCDYRLWDTVALLQDAQDALEHFPEQPFVYYVLGTVYNIKADYTMAMQYLEQSAQLISSDNRLLAVIYGDLGDIYQNLGNSEKSDLNYRKSLKIEPENELVLNNFAYFLSVRKEHLDEAEKMARSVCQKNPNNPTYLDTFAWTLYQQGKYKDAKGIMELAIQKGGEKEAALLEHFGDILWKNDEKERAIDLWKQAQTLDEKACSEYLNDKIKTQTLIEK